MKYLEKQYALRKQKAIWLKISLILFIVCMCLIVYIYITLNKIEVDYRASTDIHAPRHEFIRDR